MIKLNTTQEKILNVIKDWQEKYKNSPNPADLKYELKKSYSSIMYNLYALEKYGYIEIIRIRRRLLIKLLAGK